MAATPDPFARRPAAGLTRRRLLERAGAVGALAVAGSSAAPAGARTRAPRARLPFRRTFGAELEYYRSDPAHLEARLRVCVAAGYTTIQTYVPWNVHESTRGDLDFSGRTRPVLVDDHADEYQIETPDQEVAAGGLPGRVVANTDLLAFIDACRRLGLDLILRPGPFISDEWRNGGLPDWLLESYPDMFQRGPGGTALEPGVPFSPPVASITGGGPLFYFAGPSYASPDYHREAVRWMTAFAGAIRPHLRSRGGPVTSLQVDDEICFYYRFGPFEVDYHPAMLQRFGGPAPTGWPAAGGTPADLLPALRWQRFKARQLAVWLATMKAALRAGGADVPVFHEQELQLCPPANLAQLAAAVDVLHPEFYLDPGPWSQPTLELCAGAVRAAQRHRRTVISDEMSDGDVFVRHLLLGEGIAGFLGFSYTEGLPDDAARDMGVLGRTLALAGHRIAESGRRADAAIVWSPEQLYVPYQSDRHGFEHDVRNVIERDVPALATLLIRAGLAFDLLDTDVARPADFRRYPSIWLAASDVLPRAAQEALVEYVRGGGRLICWPAPPTLDEDYAPCTVLRDALYGETLGPRFPEDAQTISVGGRAVTVWRGVQTYELSGAARAVATREGAVCGYERRHGRGRALLLGAWLVADSVTGRIGDVLDIEDAPSPPGGPPHKTIVFDYTNERRGGEVISGGTVATWDGENVLAAGPEINTALADPTQPPIPARPIAPGHLAVARALHGRQPLCVVSDRRAQARVLDARRGEAATISVVNRYEVDVRLSIRTRNAGRRARLPLQGDFLLPASTALLLPLDYALGGGLVVEQATVQLVDAEVGDHTARLTVRAPAPGEIVLRPAGRLLRARVDGRPAATSRARGLVKIDIPAGERRLEVAWR